MSAMTDAIGIVNLSDRGLPMAKTIARAGRPLDVWARQQTTLDASGGSVVVSHDAGIPRNANRFAGIDAKAMTARGLTGAYRLPNLVHALNH